MLSKAGAPLTLLQLLPRADEQAVQGVIADVCMAIKKLAVNDDICKELADAGALDITLPVCVLLEQLAKREYRGCTSSCSIMQPGGGFLHALPCSCPCIAVVM